MNQERKINFGGEERFLNKNALLARVVQSPVIQKDLQDNNATWLAHPSAAKSLDLAFVPKRRNNHEFVRLNLFGNSNCVGVIVCESSETDDKRVEIENDLQIQRLIQEGGSISIITPEELTNWEKFYNQIYTDNIYKELGEKAKTISGLERTTQEDFLSLERATNNLTEKEHDYLEKQGVSNIQKAYGLDLAFLDKFGNLVLVPVYHVRRADLMKYVLRERVLSKRVKVPGFVLKQNGESKRMSYQRANELEKNFQVGGEDIAVPVVSEGQLSLWYKLGFHEQASSHLKKTNLSTEEVIRFLYLGESNINPGELAKLGFSLPGKNEGFPEVDILIYGRDIHNKRRYKPTDNFLSLNLSSLKRNKFETLALANVGGIVIVPKNWRPERISDYIKHITYDLNYRTLGPDMNLLILTRELFEVWKTNGTAFSEETRKVKEFDSIQQRSEYGFGVYRIKEVELRILRHEPEIGGTRIIVNEVGEKEQIGHGVDFGTSFNVANSALRELTSRSPTNIGLRRVLETGELPMITGAYATEYLLASIKNYPAILEKRSNNNPVASYLRAELVHRKKWRDIVRIMGIKEAKELYNLGKKDENMWYKEGDQAIKTWILSHAHVDHCGLIPFLEENINIYGTAETVAQLKAMSKRATVWGSKYDVVSSLTRPKIGSAYQKTYRNLVPIYWSGKPFRLSTNLIGQLNLVDHSIVGAAMVGISNTANEELMLYTGDYKIGEQTYISIEKLSKREYPVIITESTNPPDSDKPIVTEEVVRDTMREIVEDRKNDVIVVIAPTNNLKRLESIQQVAEDTGRKIALSVFHAEQVEQLRAESGKLKPLGVSGFNIELPTLGEDAALFYHHPTQPRKYQKELRNLSEEGSLGIVDTKRLTKEGEKWIVVVTPYILLRHHLGGGSYKGISVLHSSYYPYQNNAARLISENRKWTQDMGGRYYSDFTVYGDGGRVNRVVNYNTKGKLRGLHSSGHATFDQAVEVLDILMNGNYKDKTIVLIHGEKPHEYKQKLLRSFGLDHPDDLTIYTNLARYDPKKPISNPGFILRLN